MQICPLSWRTCSFICRHVLTQMFQLTPRSDTDVSIVATFRQRCLNCRHVLTHMFQLPLRSDTDVSNIATFWHRCFNCSHFVTQMFQLSPRCDTDVSIVATLWHRCFNCRHVLTQMFQLSPRCDTDVSIVATFWHRYFNCRHVVTHMFQLSPRSDTDVSLVVTFWHRFFTCHQVLACIFSRLSLRCLTFCFNCCHALALILFHVTTLEIQAEKLIRLKNVYIYIYILRFQPHFLLQYEAMHRVKCAPNFQKYQGLTYAENGLRFFLKRRNKYKRLQIL
jgi:hypothetical protein